MAKFSLGDDGTMDTVVVCDECGRELRYTYDGEHGESYEDFVDRALKDAEENHDCEDEDA